MTDYTINSREAVRLCGTTNIAVPVVGTEVRLLVDNAGHLQVDIIASALPAGSSTAANQALILAQLQDWDYTIGADFLANIPFGSPDGVNFFEFNVNNAGDLAINITDPVSGLQTNIFTLTTYATPNLDGAEGIVTASLVYGRTTSAAVYETRMIATGIDNYSNSSLYALNTMSFLMGFDGTTWDRIGAVTYNYEGAGRTGFPTMASLHAEDNGAVLRRVGMTQNPIDNHVNTDLRMLHTGAFLYGFDGTNWDRLRNTSGIYADLGALNSLAIVGVMHGQDLDAGGNNSLPIKIREELNAIVGGDEHHVVIALNYYWDASGSRWRRMTTP